MLGNQLPSSNIANCNTTSFASCHDNGQRFFPTLSDNRSRSVHTFCTRYWEANPALPEDSRVEAADRILPSSSSWSQHVMHFQHKAFKVFEHNVKVVANVHSTLAKTRC